MVVRLRNANTDIQPILTFADVRYRMLQEGDLWWAIIGVRATMPGAEYQVTASFSGGPLAGTVTVVYTDYPVDNIDIPPDRQSLLDPELVARETATLNAVYSGMTPQRRWAGLFLVPADGPWSDPFGTRRSFGGGPPTSYHTGLDIAADEGAPAVAANSGVVAFAGALPLRGNAVIIDHGAGVFTGYFHLSEIRVEPGQAVARGDGVGAVGQTGLVTGPHLHWEVAVRGVWVDPWPWTQQEFAP